MALSTLDGARFRDFAFAAADLLVSTDANGCIIEAEGDATLLHHPTADRLIGRNAVDLISEGEGSRLREELWALGPGRRLSWEDVSSIEGGRRIVIQRNSNALNCFNLIISRMPASARVRGDRMDEIMAERFRDAVMNGRLMAARQPVVETRSGAISHYEVLARFNGEDSPVSLIAAAEKSGQIAHLDYIMVSAAAAQLEANPDPDYRLAVNISGESLQRLEVIRELCAAISGRTFHRSRLIVEVTESAHIHDIETAARAVQTLFKHLSVGHLTVHWPDGQVQQAGSSEGLKATLVMHNWQPCVAAVRSGDIGRESTVLYAHLGGQPAINAYHRLWN